MENQDDNNVFVGEDSEARKTCKLFVTVLVFYGYALFLGFCVLTLILYMIYRIGRPM